MPVNDGGNSNRANAGALATSVHKTDHHIQMEHTDEFVPSFDGQLGSDYTR